MGLASQQSASDLKDAPAARAGARLWQWAALGVLALAGLMFFVRLGARALWSSEFRWAEIAREMLVTHRYFWPTINGAVYYDKPLGSYWLVVASTFITGRLNEAAARLPCAIAGLLAVALLCLLVRRLYGWRSAALAGFILATSYSFVFFSRTASADVETITGELGALLLFMSFEERQKGWWVVGLWLIMAATSLTKGLLGFVLPIMIIGLYCVLGGGVSEFGARVLHGPLVRRVRWIIERNRWLFNWRSLIAIAVGFAFYYWPFWLSRDVTGSHKGIEMVIRENVIRFFHPFDHRGPVYLYVYVIFALMVPWSPLLPAALVQAHQDRHAGRGTARADRFTLIYFWATFFFYTASGSRRSYYILPILPAAAILVARVLLRPRRELSVAARRLLNLGYLIIAAAVVLGLAALLPPAMVLRGRLARLPPAPDRIVLGAFLALSLASIGYALSRWRRASVVLSLCVVAYLSMFYVYVFAFPAADRWRGEKPFALSVLKEVGPDTAHLALFRTKGPLFYLNLSHRLPEFEHAAPLRRAVDGGAVQYVIVRRRDIPAMKLADNPARAVPARGSGNRPAADNPQGAAGGGALRGTIVDAEPSFPFEGKYEYRNKVVLMKLSGSL